MQILLRPRKAANSRLHHLRLQTLKACPPSPTLFNIGYPPANQASVPLQKTNRQNHCGGVTTLEVFGSDRLFSLSCRGKDKETITMYIPHLSAFWSKGVTITSRITEEFSVGEGKGGGGGTHEHCACSRSERNKKPLRRLAVLEHNKLQWAGQGGIIEKKKTAPQPKRLLFLILSCIV